MSKRPVKRPDSIKIGAFYFKVTPECHSDSLGEFEAQKLRIGLSVDIANATVEAETLLHEVLHAIWWAYVIKSGDEEERVVSTLGMGLSQVWHDNPQFVEWLMQSLWSRDG